MHYFKNENILPFSGLTEEQRSIVINAKMEGKVEVLAGGYPVWKESNNDTLAFHRIYRVAPAPITFRELVDLMYGMPNSGIDTRERLAGEIFYRGLDNEA